jgi:hypothetical protein
MYGFAQQIYCSSVTSSPWHCKYIIHRHKIGYNKTESNKVCKRNFASPMSLCNSDYLPNSGGTKRTHFASEGRDELKICSLSTPRHWVRAGFRRRVRASNNHLSFLPFDADHLPPAHRRRKSQGGAARPGARGTEIGARASPPCSSDEE